MPDRKTYIPGVPCWVDTSQPDPDGAVEFYAGLFGWEFEDAMPPGAPGKYFIARLRGGTVAAVGSVPESAPPTATWDTYIWVESADDTASKVRDAGGGVVREPFDVPGAGRTAVFTDPEGAAFCVWQAYGHKGAEIVNEPGSVNFNDLYTRDVEGAKSFYGAVFGWETLALGGGFEMWTLPGYGDFLERDDPDLRKRLSEFGGEPGFEDVVASISPIADDQQDVPAHWGVTFAVADADAVAEQAAELGGTVVVAPFDAPWVRMTVLTDPQGATFTASKFAPENAGLGANADTAVGAADSSRRMTPEASLEKTELGLVPQGDGWFVVNARDVTWIRSEERGQDTDFEGRQEWTDLGFRIQILAPGQRGVYHGERGQENFLVVSGECVLVIEGEERELEAWDFVHCPPWTKHTFVGAGDGPCVIVMAGSRAGGFEVVYAVNDVAARHGASVLEETSNPDEAYARFGPEERSAYRDGWLP